MTPEMLYYNQKERKGDNKNDGLQTLCLQHPHR